MEYRVPSDSSSNQEGLGETTIYPYLDQIYTEIRRRKGWERVKLIYITP